MDTADGEGLRSAVYFSGCQRALEGNACPGCHNAVAWKADSGQLWTTDVRDELLKSIEPSYIKGLSVLGGEPFSDFNLDGFLDLVQKFKELYPNKDIWVWSGYTVEEILNNPVKAERARKIFHYIDYLVDGPFIQDLKDLNLRFKGSSNQRIFKIDHSNNDTFTIQNF